MSHISFSHRLPVDDDPVLDDIQSRFQTGGSEIAQIIAAGEAQAQGGREIMGVLTGLMAGSSSPGHVATASGSNPRQTGAAVAGGLGGAALAGAAGAGIAQAAQKNKGARELNKLERGAKRDFRQLERQTAKQERIDARQERKDLQEPEIILDASREWPSPSS
ncbi:MAG TPA: hypothetical protein VFX30_14355 [bacterium]|nr:hypothetical protein [bacterium]